MEEFGSEVYHPRYGVHFYVLVDRVPGLCIFYLTADSRRPTQTGKPGRLEAGRPGSREAQGEGRWKMEDRCAMMKDEFINGIEPTGLQ